MNILTSEQWVKVCDEDDKYYAEKSQKDKGQKDGIYNGYTVEVFFVKTTGNCSEIGLWIPSSKDTYCVVDCCALKSNLTLYEIRVTNGDDFELQKHFTSYNEMMDSINDIKKYGWEHIVHSDSKFHQPY